MTDWARALSDWTRRRALVVLGYLGSLARGRACRQLGFEHAAVPHVRVDVGGAEHQSARHAEVLETASDLFHLADPAIRLWQHARQRALDVVAHRSQVAVGLLLAQDV